MFCTLCLSDHLERESCEQAANPFGPVISSYSRTQAIDDGILVDVSTVAREAGIKYPVAVTRAVWEGCVTVPKGNKIQSESGRLWDVVSMLRFALLSIAKRGGSQLLYKLKVSGRIVVLKAMIGPGDNTEPVLTIMYPDED